ncbi:hypothetical protein QYE76_020539 [Lolium multiflorum]|uniref:Uncharacterized protein n=1 Tax=Lolium multiflorum TaxID=4521 RepID=A0AAD8R631_LOLMU|nr:hypothetical protein QYE76_020539 [Lolium multiflorum]
MENYSLFMGAAALMKMAVEMAVSMEKPSGGTSPSRRRAGTEILSPDLGFAMAAALEGFAYRGFFFSSHLLRAGFMPSYYCWTKHGERGVMMEENEEEEEDDDGYPNFPDDTAEGNEDNEVEDQEAPDEPADDDLGRAIADARRECETEKERLAFDKMIEDHNKLLYPTCEDGHKKLGSTLELLQWKAEVSLTQDLESC